MGLKTNHMDRRKRMHGRKRRSSPVKLSQMWVGDGPPPSAPTMPGVHAGMGFGMAATGENATNYNPEKQADRMQKMLQDAQLAARRYQMQNPYKGLSKGGNGAHSHSGHRMRNTHGIAENERTMAQTKMSNTSMSGEQVQGSDVLAAFTQAASPVAKKNKKKLKNKNKK